MTQRRSTPTWCADRRGAGRPGRAGRRCCLSASGRDGRHRRVVHGRARRALITEVPGSSGYFLGGVVTYANEVKTGLADVPAERPRGARRRVAPRSRGRWPRGPRGRLGRRRRGRRHRDRRARTAASAAKPVGLTYVAVADGGGDDVRRHPCGSDRTGNKRASAGRRPGARCSSAWRAAQPRDARRRRHRRRVWPRPGRPAHRGRRAASTSSAPPGPARVRRRSSRAAPGRVVSGCDAGGPSPYTAALDAAGIEPSPGPRPGARHRRAPARSPRRDEGADRGRPRPSGARGGARPPASRSSRGSRSSPTRPSAGAGRASRGRTARARRRAGSSTSWSRPGGTLGVRRRVAAGGAHGRPSGDGALGRGDGPSSWRRTSTPATSTRTGRTSRS